MESQRWHAFVADNRDLLVSSGMPFSIYESREMWDDLLMHGYIDHHADATRFTVDQIGDSQKNQLQEAIVYYLHAGFADPGLGIFSAEIHENIRRRAAESV